MTVKVVNILDYRVVQTFNWPVTWRQDFFAGAAGQEFVELNEDQQNVGMYWRYEFGEFLPPPDDTPTFGRIITRLAYRNRFNQTEKVTIKMASLGLIPELTPQQRAAIAVAEDDIMAAGYIHLDRPETIAGTQALEAAGLIGVGRATAILSPPVYSAELLAESREMFGLPPVPTDNELSHNNGKGYITVGEFLADN